MSDDKWQETGFFSIISIHAWKQRLVLWIGAVFVGLFIVAMTLLSEWASDTYRRLFEPYPCLAFIVAPLGMSITAWLTFRFFPGSERSGIPQIKTALVLAGNPAERYKLISLRIALGKTMLPIMGLMSGASVGFGGPAIHVGASLMHGLAKLTRFPPYFIAHGLILAGSSAGFAAMFSAPLAGILFAIEEMGRELEERISSVVLTAIIISGVTAYFLLHHYIFLENKSLILMLYGRDWLAIPLCGFYGGLLGGLFSKATLSGMRLLNNTRIPAVAVAMLCGLAIAVLGYFSQGETYGTGYHEAKDILDSAGNIDPLYPLLKMLSICATFFSGIPSGIFVPSLATGAGFGANLAHWLPAAPASTMILLTMASYFSGVLQAPLTSFVIVMEITDTHDMLIPLMASVFIANATAKLMNPVPFYQALCDDYLHKAGSS
ncbi:MAG: chloride channel protein [Gammaproteobacteria bacterium]